MSLISAYLFIITLIVSLSSLVSFSFSLFKLALFLFLLQLIIVLSFCLFFLLFILGFILIILQLLFSIYIRNMSHYSILLLSVSSSWLSFPFRLPVGLYITLFLLLLSVTSVFTPSVLSVVFTVLLVVYYNRGGKPNWLRL